MQTDNRREAFEKLNELVNFLLGESQYMGLSFGDSVMRGRTQARFWWRHDLRKLWQAALASAPAVEAPREVVEAIAEILWDMSPSHCDVTWKEQVKLWPSHPVTVSYQNKAREISSLLASRATPQADAVSALKALVEWADVTDKNVKTLSKDAQVVWGAALQAVKDSSHGA